MTWFELDYKLDEFQRMDKATSDIHQSRPKKWTSLISSGWWESTYDSAFAVTPGIPARPCILAIIIFAVMRVDVKAIYGSLDVLCEDLYRAAGFGRNERGGEAGKCWRILGMPAMILCCCCSVSSLFDNKMVFLNGQPQADPVSQAWHGRRGDAYVVCISFQDA